MLIRKLCCTILILIALSGQMVHATSFGPEFNKGGGTDAGGGGNVPKSTIDVLADTADDVKQLFISYDLFRLISTNFREIKRIKTAADVEAADIFKALGNYEDHGRPGFRIIEKTDIVIDEACYGKNDEESDAAVTSDGTVCLSERLTRFPAGQLLTDVLIELLAHEFAHVLKRDEHDAEIVQAFMHKHLAFILGRDGGPWKEAVLNSIDLLIAKFKRCSSAECYQSLTGHLEGLRQMIATVSESNANLGLREDILPFVDEGFTNTESALKAQTDQAYYEAKYLALMLMVYFTGQKNELLPWKTL